MILFAYSIIVEQQNNVLISFFYIYLQVNILEGFMQIIIVSFYN